MIMVLFVVLHPLFPRCVSKTASSNWANKVGASGDFSLPGCNAGRPQELELPRCHLTLVWTGAILGAPVGAPWRGAWSLVFSPVRWLLTPSRGSLLPRVCPALLCTPWFACPASQRSTAVSGTIPPCSAAASAQDPSEPSPTHFPCLTRPLSLFSFIFNVFCRCPPTVPVPFLALILLLLSCFRTSHLAHRDFPFPI
ncbi:hypothetical protein QBC34DRAFT_113879 [Podospora aff. communis PSN243]|uniref:Secreted protein n=1 Tax=Podospora aff. communis PSN243 TaxID=3040156 RepID=A0AAV9GJ30_9PEZI|nr:hypothetical protein QBC34DRAFT_113879 [Podospora aff. communis PSN243]